MMNPSDIQSLANLLKTGPMEDSSSDDDLPRTGYATMGPGDINKGTKIKIKGNEGDVENKEKIIPNDPKSIWDVSEVPEVPYSDDALSDPREKPKYDIKYKQAVKTEDIYLQMSNKTPTTASCESMIITITIEDENKDDIDCHVRKNNLDIRSPKYRLNLALPHPVDPDSSNAEFDPATSELKINLQMSREFDYVNF